MPRKSKQVEKLEQEIADVTADMQRIQADFVNYKRRADEDFARAANNGKQSTVQKILPVVDTLNRALTNIPKDLKSHDFVKGVQGIEKQLSKALADLNVTKIKALNQDFDADKMDAVAVEDGEGEREVVIEVMQEGYQMGDTVIRHAMVKVGRK